MSITLKPCHCGYAGDLAGIQFPGFYVLGCPECQRTVEAFTLEGLADRWNEPAQAKEGAQP